MLTRGGGDMSRGKRDSVYNVHVCMGVYECMCVRARVRSVNCVRACVRSRVHVCVCVCVNGHVGA